MKKKWITLLTALAFALAATGAASAFALSGDGTGSSTAVSEPLRDAEAPDGDKRDQVEQPASGQPPVRSDEGIEPEQCSLVHNINACFAGGEPASDIPMDEYTGVLTLALFDLAGRLGLDHVGFIVLSDIERATWGNVSLGNPQPGMVYAEVIVAGFWMVLEANGEPYVALRFDEGLRGEAGSSVLEGPSRELVGKMSAKLETET